MSGKIGNSVDLKLVKEALTNIKVSGDFESFVQKQLTELLKILRGIAIDQGTEAAKNFAGTPPGEQREAFERYALRLEDLASQLGIFEEPLQRYLVEGDPPPTRPTGLTEFRESIANLLTGALSAEYIGSFGARPVQWNTNDVSLEHINTLNRATTLEMQAENITIDLLKRLAAAMRAAAEEIRENTRSGGPRDSKVRRILLINLVALWQQIHSKTDQATYSGGETKFFSFCISLSRAIGLGTLCTETHLAEAVTAYNAKILPETLPEFDPVLAMSAIDIGKY